MMGRAMAVKTAIPERPIPLSVPTLQGNEWTYLKECLDTGWVSSVGPFVDRFERAVAVSTGATHAVAVVNGTAALHIALRVIDVQPEDEVLVSDLTFIAPVNAIRYCGAHPVFMDVDANTWQMDLDKTELFLSRHCALRRAAGGTSVECRNLQTGRRIKALLPVHILGSACAMERVLALAERFHLRVVEDAAEGMGVRYQGRHVGTWGDVGVVSFNGNKIITAGGGGMLLTHDPDAAAYARYLTTQAKEAGVEYIHQQIGYNYRLTNLHAAVGLAQLEQLDAFVARKRSIARAYEEGLRGLKGVELMPLSARTEATYWLYTILLPKGTTVPERQAWLTRLREQGIEARPLWHPIHGLEPYRRCQAFDITCADELYARAVSLPSSSSLSESDVAYCIEAVRRLLSA